MMRFYSLLLIAFLGFGFVSGCTSAVCHEGVSDSVAVEVYACNGDIGTAEVVIVDLNGSNLEKVSMARQSLSCTTRSADILKFGEVVDLYREFANGDLRRVERIIITRIDAERLSIQDVSGSEFSMMVYRRIDSDDQRLDSFVQWHISSRDQSN